MAPSRSDVDGAPLGGEVDVEAEGEEGEESSNFAELVMVLLVETTARIDGPSEDGPAAALVAKPTVESRDFDAMVG